MVIPGIFEESFSEVIVKVNLVKDFVFLIQIDIADGNLVNGKTFLDIKNLEYLESIDCDFELHLMVKDPLAFITRKYSNVSRICIQIECFNDDYKVIESFKQFGYKVGVSLNPETKLEELDPFIYDADFVQFMTVVPGGSGREFHAEVLDKIIEFKKLYPELETQVDGGVKISNIHQLAKTGVDNFVVTSGLFGCDNIAESFNKLEELCKIN